MMPAVQPQSESFAALVRSLRKELGETQGVFAERVGRARTYITALEKGKPPAEVIRDDFIKAFSDYEDRIRAAYDTSIRALPPARRRTRQTRFQRTVESFLNTGRFSYAVRALERALLTESDDAERYWLSERLYVALRASGSDNDLAILAQAVEAAVRAELVNEEITCRDRLAGRYQIIGEFTAAHELVNDGLQRHPHSDRLWLRKGKVHWYETAYPEAYAALTTARTYGCSRTSVLHARSQVLAEWGSFEQALADSADYLALAKGTIPANIVAVRTARAYVWALTGDLDRALKEFAELRTKKQGRAWFYYRRGLSYVAHDQIRRARADFQCSVDVGSASSWPNSTTNHAGVSGHTRYSRLVLISL
jgi:transcriptional regulator with XRE-family HTH domain